MTHTPTSRSPSTVRNERGPWNICDSQPLSTSNRAAAAPAPTVVLNIDKARLPIASGVPRRIDLPGRSTRRCGSTNG